MTKTFLIRFSVFLINVLRVIVRKLHPQSAQPAPLAIRKAVRATIILVRYIRELVYRREKKVKVKVKVTHNT